MRKRKPKAKRPAKKRQPTRRNGIPIHFTDDELSRIDAAKEAASGNGARASRNSIVREAVNLGIEALEERLGISSNQES